MVSGIFPSVSGGLTAQSSQQGTHPSAGMRHVDHCLASSLLVFPARLVIVVLEGWLHSGLGRVLGIGCDFFAVVLFLLLDFFIVGDIAWISHGYSSSWQ
jgi:hypothetical protein